MRRGVKPATITDKEKGLLEIRLDPRHVFTRKGTEEDQRDIKPNKNCLVRAEGKRNKGEQGKN